MRLQLGLVLERDGSMRWDRRKVGQVPGRKVLT
jgi:hypothetical protein